MRKTIAAAAWPLLESGAGSAAGVLHWDADATSLVQIVITDVSSQGEFQYVPVKLQSTISDLSAHYIIMGADKSILEFAAERSIGGVWNPD